MQVPSPAFDLQGVLASGGLERESPRDNPGPALPWDLDQHPVCKCRYYCTLILHVSTVLMSGTDVWY